MYAFQDSDRALRICFAHSERKLPPSRAAFAEAEILGMEKCTWNRRSKLARGLGVGFPKKKSGEATKNDSRRVCDVLPVENILGWLRD